MKLESLKSGKFEVLTNESMKLVSGGAAQGTPTNNIGQIGYVSNTASTATGSTSGASGLCFSNDYIDNAGKKWGKSGGGDFDQATLQALVKN